MKSLSLKQLKKKLEKIEKQLEAVRGCSPLTHGWQTKQYARMSRKWDLLAQDKRNILELIEKLKQLD